MPDSSQMFVPLNGHSSDPSPDSIPKVNGTPSIPPMPLDFYGTWEAYLADKYGIVKPMEEDEDIPADIIVTTFGPPEDYR